jgi:hypothetical protein
MPIYHPCSTPLSAADVAFFVGVAAAEYRDVTYGGEIRYRKPLPVAFELGFFVGSCSGR